jgi:hypothetical protein
MILAVKGIETDERFHAHPYNKKASAGTRSCAIGYATRLHNGLCTKADDAKYRHGITRPRAQGLLLYDLRSAGSTIAHYVHIRLSTEQ